MERPTEKELEEKLKAAQAFVEVGARYRHYKNENGLYRVTGLVVRQEDYRIGVVYVAEYGARLVWERPLEEFTDTTSYNGQAVPRFVKVI